MWQVRNDNTIYRAPSTDIDGNVRPSVVDQFVDIGACESGYSVGEAYPTSFTLSDRFVLPVSGTLHCASDILNYHNQDIRVYCKFYDSDSSIQDSVEMFDDGQHADGTAVDGLYGGSYQPDLEETFTTSSRCCRITIMIPGTEYGGTNKFTTIGPVKLAGFELYLQIQYLIREII